jgi:hypothetical protein
VFCPGITGDSLDNYSVKFAQYLKEQLGWRTCVANKRGFADTPLRVFIRKLTFLDTQLWCRDVLQLDQMDRLTRSSAIHQEEIPSGQPVPVWGINGGEFRIKIRRRTWRQGSCPRSGLYFKSPRLEYAPKIYWHSDNPIKVHADPGIPVRSQTSHPPWELYGISEFSRDQCW